MQEILIGRQEEKRLLQEWIDSDRSEFIAVYGRRRVGKTFLIKKAVGKQLTFHFSGSYGLARKSQLLNFGLELRLQGKNPDIPIPENWVMAFYNLRLLLEDSSHEKKVVFIDELPWINTPKSGFVPALENFWNGWASWRDDIKLIVCGSATSWIINKIIRDKGGLHGRTTRRLLVKPFDLFQSEEYFRAYGFNYSRMQIAECYMTMGGIPYYFSLMDRGESLSQNIDRLFFNPDAPLHNEFVELYRALYKNYQAYIKIIKSLAKKGIGLTRRELVEDSGLVNNGEFSNILEELELCGFIRSYLPFDGQRRTRSKSGKISPDTLYQLVDFYSLFYLRFHDIMTASDRNPWSGMVNSPKVNAWRGLTFEMLCLCHIPQIKRALGIADVSTSSCSWRGEAAGKSVQIDLLIDRKDDTINLCEMKFSRHEFEIDKAYADSLRRKIDVFIEKTKTHKSILLTMITGVGIYPNSYADIVQRQLTLDSLF